MESSYTSELYQLRTELSEVEKSLENVRQYLKSLSSRLEAIESKLSSNEKAVHELGKNLAGVSSSITALGSAVADVGRRVDSLGQSLVGELRRIVSSEAAGLRNEIRSGISGLSSSLSSVLEREKEISEKISSIRENLASVGERLESGLRGFRADILSSLESGFRSTNDRVDKSFKGIEELIRTQDSSLRRFIEEQSDLLQNTLEAVKGELFGEIARSTVDQKNLIGEVRKSVDKVYDSLRPLEDRLQKRIEESATNLRDHLEKSIEELSRKSEENYKMLEGIMGRNAEELQGLILYHQSFEEGRVAWRDLQLVDLLYAVLKRLEQLELRLSELENRVMAR